MVKIKFYKASALLLTMFIMAGMLIVAMSGVYIILLGIKAAGVQSQSTRAYYTAEAGAERFLWELRRNGCQSAFPSCTLFPSSSNPIFQATLSGGGSYQVYYTATPLIFQSVGDFQNTKRSVELRLE